MFWIQPLTVKWGGSEHGCWVARIEWNVLGIGKYLSYICVQHVYCIELPWFLETSYQTKLYCTNHFALVTLFLRNIMVHTKNTPRGTVRNWPILCNSIADPDLVGSVSCFRLNKYLNLGSRDPNSDYCFVNLVLSNKKSVFCSFRKCLPHIVK